MNGLNALAHQQAPALLLDLSLPVEVQLLQAPQQELGVESLDEGQRALDLFEDLHDEKVKMRGGKEKKEVFAGQSLWASGLLASSRACMMKRKAEENSSLCPPKATCIHDRMHGDFLCKMVYRGIRDSMIV